MSSVGRYLAKDLINTAERLRRYSALLDDFDTTDALHLGEDTLADACRLEDLVPRLLAFEGENVKALPAGAS